MNKLIIGGQEYELMEYGDSNAAKTPAIQFDGKYYLGKAIVNEKPKSYEVLERFNYGEVPCDGDIAPIKIVRRLSDGEVFTIGDEVRYSGEKCNYNSFIIDNFIQGRPSGFLLARNKHYTICEYISEIKKIKNRILITTDGKDIYEGDRVWFVTPARNYEVDFYDFIDNGNEDDLTIYPDMHQYFSTEETAKDWVLMNNPCLSLNDLLDNWGDRNYNNREYFLDAPLFLKFKNAAKQKISGL